MNVNIIRSEFIANQVFAKSAFLGKSVPKYADSAVGKWVVVAEIDGMTLSGIGETIDAATESAKSKRVLFY